VRRTVAGPALPVAGDDQPAGQRERIRRLFAVLEDVARYAAGYARSEMLADTWARIGDLLQQPGGPASITTAVRTAAERVGDHEAGSASWWRAVWATAKAWEDSCQVAGDRAAQVAR
jgi:hypothetical protein